MITHPLRGSIFETFIISELIKSKLNRGVKPAFSFWRDSSGNEVDLLVEQGTRLIPVEIKSGRYEKTCDKYFINIYKGQRKPLRH